LEIPVEMVQFLLKIRAKILRTPKNLPAPMLFTQAHWSQSHTIMDFSNLWMQTS